MNSPLKPPHFYTMSTFQLGASEIIERAVQEPIIFIHNQFSIIRRLFLTSSRVLSYIHPTLLRTYFPTLQRVAVFESRLVHSSQQNKIWLGHIWQNLTVNQRGTLWKEVKERCNDIEIPFFFLANLREKRSLICYRDMELLWAKE
jgi:hypothetical protein